MSQSVARLLREYKNICEDPPERWTAYPLEKSDPKLWHFVMMGPTDSPYEGGLYHGRVLLPDRYPLEAPSIQFDTPNGRFNTGMKVCFNATAHHPEHWQPAWGIRSLIDAVQAYILVEDSMSIGSMTVQDSEKKRLAESSRSYLCSACGLTNEAIMHDILTQYDEKEDSASLIDGPGIPANMNIYGDIEANHTVKTVSLIVGLRMLFSIMIKNLTGQRVENESLALRVTEKLIGYVMIATILSFLRVVWKMWM